MRLFRTGIIAWAICMMTGSLPLFLGGCGGRATSYGLLEVELVGAAPSTGSAGKYEYYTLEMPDAGTPIRVSDSGLFEFPFDAKRLGDLKVRGRGKRDIPSTTTLHKGTPLDPHVVRISGQVITDPGGERPETLWVGSDGDIKFRP